MERLILQDILTFAFGVVSIGCVTAIIITFLKRRSIKAGPDLTGRLNDIADRLSRLDGAIDTIAVEVERISEAQRFTAKVLADRTGAPAIPDKSRAGPQTPH